MTPILLFLPLHGLASWVLHLGGGKVVGMEGPPPPKRVGLTVWDSLEKAEAFYKSKAFTDLPDREKSIKTIRRYAVEVAN